MSQALVPTAEQAVVLEAEQIVEPIIVEAEDFLAPIGLDSKFFAQCTVTALVQNSHLRHANRDSFKAALLKCAQRGLLPDGESAALVPMKGNVTLVPMVGGMLDIVRRTLPGCSITAKAVMRWDHFTVKHGTDPVLEHIPGQIPEGIGPLDLDKPENVTGAWCVVILPPLVRGAAPVREIHHMRRIEIDLLRQRSPAGFKQGLPWTVHYRRMCEKSVIKACLRRLPSRHQIFAQFDPQSLEDYSLEVVKAESQPVAALMPPKREIEAPKAHRI